jgi:hypothetical protein
MGWMIPSSDTIRSVPRSSTLTLLRYGRSRRGGSAESLAAILAFPSTTAAATAPSIITVWLQEHGKGGSPENDGAWDGRPVFFVSRAMTWRLLPHYHLSIRRSLADCVPGWRSGAQGVRRSPLALGDRGPWCPRGAGVTLRNSRRRRVDSWLARTDRCSAPAADTTRVCIGAATATATV